MEARTDRARVDVDPTGDADVGPVLLATIGVPFDERAAVRAVDAAVQDGRRLIVVNATKLEPLSLSIRLGYDALEELTPEVSASVRRPVQLAASLGIWVERLRVRSPRPIAALLALATERDPGLIVFGPDRDRLGGRAYRAALQALADGAICPVWTPTP